MKKRPASPPDSPFMTVEDIASLLSISQRTVWRFVAEGRMPKPTRISRSVQRWRRTDIMRWLDQL